jgi:predicted TIM-barrel fold metal-dependent hydrolase
MDDRINRRTFLQGTAVALLTGPALSAAGEERKAVFPIIDTHQHLWDLDKFRLAWLDREPSLKRSYRMEDYLRVTGELKEGSGSLAPAGVVKAIYMEVDVMPEQQQAEADFILSVCRAGNTPTVAAVVSGRPASEEFAAYARQFKGSRYIKGIRQVLHGPTTPAGYCLDPRFIAGIRLLGELELSFDLCFRSAELPDAANLVDACPDTRFILDHCGNANVQSRDLSAWRRGIAALAKRKNVVGKVSGIVAFAKPGSWTADDLAPVINHTLEVFGPDRVMFGGDWPVCTLAASYKQWVDALRTIVRGRPEAEQRKLFHDNAAAFYGVG